MRGRGAPMGAALEGRSVTDGTGLRGTDYRTGGARGALTAPARGTSSGESPSEPSRIRSPYIGIHRPVADGQECRLMDQPTSTMMELAGRGCQRLAPWPSDSPKMWFH